MHFLKKNLRKNVWFILIDVSKNRFVFLILDTLKIYPGSLNNTVSRNTICRWFIRRHFQPETCVGFSPSIPREVHGKTIPEIAVLSGSIVVITVMFSIHPPRMKCYFATLVREYISREVDRHTLIVPLSSLVTTSFSLAQISLFVFEGVWRSYLPSYMHSDSLDRAIFLL